MDLEKLNVLQITCFLLSADAATHRWKLTQFMKQMRDALILHFTALNQQLISQQI
jgi:hypothetical protein